MSLTLSQTLSLTLLHRACNLLGGDHPLPKPARHVHLASFHTCWRRWDSLWTPLPNGFRLASWLLFGLAASGAMATTDAAAESCHCVLCALMVMLCVLAAASSRSFTLVKAIEANSPTLVVSRTSCLACALADPASCISLLQLYRKRDETVHRHVRVPFDSHMY